MKKNQTKSKVIPKTHSDELDISSSEEPFNDSHGIEIEPSTAMSPSINIGVPITHARAITHEELKKRKEIEKEKEKEIISHDISKRQKIINDDDDDEEKEDDYEEDKSDDPNYEEEVDDYEEEEEEESDDNDPDYLQKAKSSSTKQKNKRVVQRHHVKPRKIQQHVTQDASEEDEEQESTVNKSDKTEEDKQDAEEEEEDTMVTHVDDSSVDYRQAEQKAYDDWKQFLEYAYKSRTITLDELRAKRKAFYKTIRQIRASTFQPPKLNGKLTPETDEIKRKYHAIYIRLFTNPKLNLKPSTNQEDASDNSEIDDDDATHLQAEEEHSIESTNKKLEGLKLAYSAALRAWRYARIDPNSDPSDVEAKKDEKNRLGNKVAQLKYSLLSEHEKSAKRKEHAMIEKVRHMRAKGHDMPAYDTRAEDKAYDDWRSFLQDAIRSETMTSKQLSAKRKEFVKKIGQIRLSALQPPKLNGKLTPESKSMFEVYQNLYKQFFYRDKKTNPLNKDTGDNSMLNDDEAREDEEEEKEEENDPDHNEEEEVHHGTTPNTNAELDALRLAYNRAYNAWRHAKRSNADPSEIEAKKNHKNSSLYDFKQLQFRLLSEDEKAAKRKRDSLMQQARNAIARGREIPRYDTQAENKAYEDWQKFLQYAVTSPNMTFEELTAKRAEFVKTIGRIRIAALQPQIINGKRTPESPEDWDTYNKFYNRLRHYAIKKLNSKDSVASDNHDVLNDKDDTDHVAKSHNGMIMKPKTNTKGPVTKSKDTSYLGMLLKSRNDDDAESKDASDIDGEEKDGEEEDGEEEGPDEQALLQGELDAAKKAWTQAVELKETQIIIAAKYREFKNKVEEYKLKFGTPSHKPS